MSLSASGGITLTYSDIVEVAMSIHISLDYISALRVDTATPSPRTWFVHRITLYTNTTVDLYLSIFAL